jgi:hypothetical protein
MQESICGTSKTLSSDRNADGYNEFVRSIQSSLNGAMNAISAYIKEFDTLADSDSDHLALRGGLLLAKYSDIFKRLLHQ